MPVNKTRVRQALRAIGLDSATRSVYSRVHPLARRDAADDAHLAVILAAVLRPDSNCIDIGANVGKISRMMLQLAPHGRHHAFEPLPELAAELRHLSDRLEVHEVALTSISGTAAFTRAVGAEGFSRLGVPPAAGTARETFDVRTSTLDDELPDNYKPDFIKIDVEGAEVSALLGAVRTIQRARPVMWIEHKRQQVDDDGKSPTVEMWTLLCEKFGYRLFTADGHGPLGLRALLPGGIDAPMWNWLAVPSASGPAD